MVLREERNDGCGIKAHQNTTPAVDVWFWNEYVQEIAMKLSIITPCLNAAQVLRCCIDSVLQQGGATIEHIIMDGGSTDGTQEILAEFPTIRWQSRADEGMYDAMNRGMAMATGDVIAFLNSDDRLAPGAVQSVAAAFRDDPAAPCVTGFAQLQPPNGDAPWLYPAPLRRLSVAAALYGPVLLNARFFRRAIFDTVGVFYPKFKVAGDRDFILRCAASGMETVQIDDIVYIYNSHPKSLTFSEQGLLTAAADNLRLSRDRLDTLPHHDPMRPLYRAWHGWSVGQNAYYAIKFNHIGQALQQSCQAFAGDCAWPYYFILGLPKIRRFRSGEFA
ncbi:MAG: glycosyltransferase family 2 protein [Acidobacteriaceae bacterium]|nr:glycosyltransferase family 2 protein [Acidobacteriaceae bacterium]